MIRLVVIESPYASDPGLKYLGRCIADCFARGEAPYASHAIGPLGLDDTKPLERKKGIEYGFAWREFSHATVVYTDYGISAGMKLGIDDAYENNHLVEFRTIGRNPEAVAREEDVCPGVGKCHGSIVWCTLCGADAADICNDVNCDLHKD